MSDCGHGFTQWSYCARCCEARAHKLSAVELRESKLCAEVAALKRRVRLARAHVLSGFSPPDFGVSGRLGTLYDLLDLRKPLSPKRQSRRGRAR